MIEVAIRLVAAITTAKDPFMMLNLDPSVPSSSGDIALLRTTFATMERAMQEK